MHALRIVEIATAAALLASVPEPALAYIDPGLGSLLFQGMIAGLVTVAAAWTGLRAKIRSLFQKKAPETDAGDKPVSQ
jgi:hypothetical protein